MDELPAHAHEIDFSANSSNDVSGGGKVGSGGSSGEMINPFDTQNAGGGLGHTHDFNALPPYLCLNYLIKT